MAACVEDRTTMVILGNKVPGEGCVTDTAGGSRTFGQLDISEYAFSHFTPQYFMFPEVVNSLSESEGDVELNYIEIIEARVELDLGDLGSSLPEDHRRFAVPAFTTLAPQASAVLQVMVIPPQTAAVIGPAVRASGTDRIVRARVHFRYEHGGYERDSHEIVFPIMLCNGCVVLEPQSCGGVLPDEIPEGNACNYTQDDPLLCCLDAGVLVCPASATEPLE